MRTNLINLNSEFWKLPAIFGGDAGEEDNESGDEDQSTDEDDSSDEDSEDDDEDDGDSDNLDDKLKGVKDEKDRRIIELANEAASRRRKARELRIENEALKKAAAEKDREKNGEDENLKQDLETATQRISKYEKVMSKNLIETAILKDSSLQFHDIDTVISALNHDDIDIDLEEGTIEGLTSELKRVAKEKPFLVKSSKKEDDKGSSRGSKGSSGNNPGGAGGSKNDKAAQRAELLKKYPHLANR